MVFFNKSYYASKFVNLVQSPAIHYNYPDLYYYVPPFTADYILWGGFLSIIYALKILLKIVYSDT